MKLTTEEIELKLSHKNTKPTSMRVVVYDLLAAQKIALSVSEIQARLEYADRVTIYRTLKTFEKKGIAHSIQENRTTKYILCEDQCNHQTHNDWHLHFYCHRCKQTSCKKDIVLTQNIKGDFQIDEIRFFAKGICENCIDKKLQ